MRRTRLRRPSRRVTIIVISIAVIVALALYGWLSLTAWQGYERRLTAERQEYTELRNAALNGKNTTDRLTALRALDDKLQGRAELCRMNPAFSWQASVVPLLQDGVAECVSAVKRLDVLAGPLGELRDYLDVGLKLRQSVTKLSPGSNLSESNWTKLGLERAKSVQREVKALKASGDAAELKRQTEELCNALVTNWESLIRANTAKDKAGFIAAAAAVATSYADFGGLADSSDAMIDKKVQAVAAAYDE